MHTHTYTHEYTCSSMTLLKHAEEWLLKLKIYAQTYIHIHIYACVYPYIYTCRYIHVYMYVYTCLCIDFESQYPFSRVFEQCHRCTCVFSCICMHMHICVFIYICAFFCSECCVHCRTGVLGTSACATVCVIQKFL